MRMSGSLRLFAACLASLFASPLSAATVIINGSGQLTGATGVNVSGTFYDVSFVEGTCVAQFNGCDNLTDFTFTSPSDALAAAQALLDQVLVDGAPGLFDSLYPLTFGCALNVFEECDVAIPYQKDVGLSTLVDTAVASNVVGGDSVGQFVASDTFDFGTDPHLVWATFSASPVPEPSSWAMLVMGFAGIGVALRCRERPQPRLETDRLS